jgi:hypothetical protein
VLQSFKKVLQFFTQVDKKAEEHLVHLQKASRKKTDGRNSPRRIRDIP